MNLNIRYDAPREVWDKVILVYEKTEGWLSYDENGIPFWFSFDEMKKHIYASVESSGLLFSGLMTDKDWDEWKLSIKDIATITLGYKVGELETGEVDF